MGTSSPPASSRLATFPPLQQFLRSCPFSNASRAAAIKPYLRDASWFTSDCMAVSFRFLKESQDSCHNKEGSRTVPSGYTIPCTLLPYRLLPLSSVQINTSQSHICLLSPLPYHRDWAAQTARLVVNYHAILRITPPPACRLLPPGFWFPDNHEK